MRKNVKPNARRPQKESRPSEGPKGPQREAPEESRGEVGNPPFRKVSGIGDVPANLVEVKV